MDFPRTLSLLRREKNLSQRKVAKELGYEQAELEVIADNEAAIGLYKKLGFEPLDYRQMVKEFR